MLSKEYITVRADWDDEAGVWVATSEEVPGLVTEAESEQALLDKLKVLAPELFELNVPDMDLSKAPPLEVVFSAREEHTVQLRTGTNG